MDTNRSVTTKNTYYIAIKYNKTIKLNLLILIVMSMIDY